MSEGTGGSSLTHLDADGRPVMVDVSGKSETQREAVAEGFVALSPATLAVLDRGNAKGDVINVATLAGIMGAKRTSDLIPLCHPLPLTSAKVEIVRTEEPPGLHVTARVRTHGVTGVEMEALTAVSVACLTVYDMLKAADKGISINAIRLVTKSGGKSGDWRRGG